jgi:hypothetical protein
MRGENMHFGLYTVAFIIFIQVNLNPLADFSAHNKNLNWSNFQRDFRPMQEPFN